MMRIFQLLALFIAYTTAWQSSQTLRQAQINRALKKTTQFVSIMAPTIAILNVNKVNAQAQQGQIKPSTTAETKAAILQLKACIELVKTFDADVAKGDFQAIGDKLNSKEFTTFEAAATTIVRSDLLTQDEKTTLGDYYVVM